MFIFFLVVVGLLGLLSAAICIGAAVDDNFRREIERVTSWLPSKSTPSIRRIEREVRIPEIVTEADMGKDFQVPEQWDPQLITQRLQDVRNNPPLLRTLFESLKQQIIHAQDYRTGNTRIRFLQTQVREMHIAKEYLTALDDLNFHMIEREIKQRELELKREDLENKRKAQEELESLRLEHEKLKIKVEMAKLRRQESEFEKGGAAATSDNPEPENVS